MPTQPGDYVLTVRPGRDPLNRPVAVRLRLSLKYLLRAQSLECVDIRETKPAVELEKVESEK